MSIRNNYARIGAVSSISSSPKELAMQRQVMLERSQPIPFRKLRDDGTIPDAEEVAIQKSFFGEKRAKSLKRKDESSKIPDFAEELTAPTDLVDESTLLPSVNFLQHRQRVRMHSISHILLFFSLVLIHRYIYRDKRTQTYFSGCQSI